MIICYDDTYWEPARLSALKGADVILYPCNAGKGLSAPGEVMPGGHFTISATQEMCAWNGLALVASDQANVHMAPSGKLGIYSAGAAAIWSPTGEKLAAAPVVPASASPGQPGAIIYAEIDPAAFERTTLEAIGMPAEIVMRHRIPHFSHIFADDGYSAGYYSYLWADTLTADAWEAFTEAGGPWDTTVAERLRRHVLSAGNTIDPEDGYRAFRGRDPQIDALMRKRGFALPR
jgi:hypothetical protein